MTTPQDPFAASGDQPPREGQQPPPPGYGAPPPGYPPGYPPPFGQSPYGQQPYGQQPYGGGQKTNTMAIVGFILTLVVCPPIGAVLCFIALGQIKRTGEGGRGLALAGVWIGVALLALFVGVIALGVMSEVAYSQ
ncbi:MAG TPA: DUF4190 domain-containing protein [Mycobacteriales bacterium]|nr:DUF4190 domain-containing protein [Mycobacteriales bacterium]